MVATVTWPACLMGSTVWNEVTTMSYRDKAIAVCKMAGQELIDRAEELIVNTEAIKNIDIWINIPSETDDPMVVPEIQVTTSVYPKRETITKIVSMDIDR